MKRTILIPLFLLVMIPVVYGHQIEQSHETLKKSLKAHIEFLADDKLKGRDTGTEEYEISANYVASHFQQFGLKPAGDHGTWFQTVPFIKSTAKAHSRKMILHTRSENVEFNYQDDFLSLPSAIKQKESLRAKLVFVGYGIVDKKLGHNDYQGLNVKDKIIVMFTGYPTSFQSEEGAHLGKIHNKIQQAVEQGAAGVILLNSPVGNTKARYQGFSGYASEPILNWQTKEGDVFQSFPSLKSITFITMGTGEVIFAESGVDLAAIFSEIKQGKAPEGFDLEIEVTLERKSEQTSISSSNVIAVLEGGDPLLKNEYIVYSAHLDHIGVNVNGEINNGALDNASGIAVMLETARKFSIEKPPKRSILFIAVTAEEKNLLGSNYFAHNPTVPLQAIVANINIDMPFLLYPFADIIAFGAERSTLGSTVKAVAQAQGLKLSPDPVPHEALFTRSDHYSFVKQGIPSIFLTPGFTALNSKTNGGQVIGRFYQQHYHQPSDDVALPINYEAGASFTEVNYKIGQIIADNISRPSWHNSDFFGDIYSK